MDAAHKIATVSGTTSSYIHENGYSGVAKFYYLVVAVDSNGYGSGAGRELPKSINAMKVTRVGSNLSFNWPAVTQDFDGRPTIITKYVLYGRSTPFGRATIGPPLLVRDNIFATNVSIPSPAGSIFFYSLIAVDNRGDMSPW